MQYNCSVFNNFFFFSREFLKKFSITIDAIPDHHPGEEIFNFLNSGKIFSQYTLAGQ